MNLDKFSLDQLRKMLVRIERQMVEDQLFVENVEDGITHEPPWRLGAVKARLEQKREERREVKERIEWIVRRPVGG